MATFFETSFGDRIELQPGLEKRLYPLAVRDAQYHQDFLSRYYATDAGASATLGSRVRVSNVENDIQTFALVADTLDQVDILPSRGVGSVLDIAGAEGVHAALFRGLWARNAEVVDLRDGRDPWMSSRLYAALARRMWMRPIDDLFDALPVAESAAVRLLGKRLPRRNPHKHLNVPTKRRYYPRGFVRPLRVDRFRVGNWLAEDLGRHDVIMSFQSFWLFEHRQALAKVAQALNPGGLFVLYAPNFWAGRPTGDSSGILGGEFAFFEQRLTREDAVRYYREFKPDRERFVSSAWDGFDPARPTSRDYVDAAWDVGLTLRAERRVEFRAPYDLVRQRGSAREVIVPATARGGAVCSVDAEEVLRNIHRFKPDVRFEDLTARATILVFQRGRE